MFFHGASWTLILPMAVFALTPAVMALVEDINKAIDRVCPKQTAAAGELQISTQRFSEFQNGKGPLDVRRLALLPQDTFIPALVHVLAERHGLAIVRHDVADLLERVEAALPPRKRMARVS